MTRLRAADFSSYETFAWSARQLPRAHADSQPPGDGAALDAEIRPAMAHELEAKRYHGADETAADLLIAHAIETRERTRLGITPAHLLRYDFSGEPYIEITLTIDAYDRAGGRSVWRGIVIRPVSSEGRMAAALRLAVADLLSRFPEGAASLQPSGLR